MSNGTPPTIDVRVARKTVEAEGVVGFELVAHGRGDLPPFEAGAHIDVHLPDGLLRQYSLCNAPAERHRYCIAVKRDAAGRGGSMSMADDLHIGHTLAVRAPDNAFALHPRAKKFLFIAGGIGITPIMAMLAQVQATQAGAFKLVYCTRDAGSTAFIEELSAPEFKGKVSIHHDHGQPVDL